MNHEQWKLWKRPRKTISEASLLRYGLAVSLTVGATAIIFARPSFSEAPFFIFLGAVVLSAATGGLAPAFISIALSVLIIRLLFVEPIGRLTYANDYPGMERMVGFVLVAMMLSSFVAGLRRERNHLLDSEERYRMLAESAEDAILVIDEKGEILFVNPAAMKTFGSQAEELLGKNLAHLVPDEGYRTQMLELKHHMDSRKRSVILRLPARRPNGEPLMVEMSLGASSHRGKNLYTAVIRDVTGRES